MERPYMRADIKQVLGLTRGQLAAQVALQKDRYQGLNGKCFNRSKTRLEHVNELLHPNSRFTTTAPLPSSSLPPLPLPVHNPTSPSQPGAAPESPLTLLASPPPQPPAATVHAAQAPSVQEPRLHPHNTSNIAINNNTKNNTQPELYSMHQFAEPNNSNVLPLMHATNAYQNTTVIPDLVAEMGAFRALTVFLIDKRLENSKRAFSVQVRTGSATPRLKEGQWHVKTSDIIDGLLKLRALFDGNIKLLSPHPSRPDYLLEFLTCMMGKIQDAPITEDSLVASMLDSETMEYGIDIIVENAIDLKQILKDLKDPTSAAPGGGLVENLDYSKPEATEMTQTSLGNTSALPHFVKGKRSRDSRDNNPEQIRAIGRLSTLAQAQPGYKRFDEGRSRSLSNSYIVERWAFVAGFLAEFNGKKCQKTGLTITKGMCRDGLAIGDTSFSEAVESDRLVKTYGRGGSREALEVAETLESDEAIGSVKLLNYLKRWKKEHP